MKYLLCICVFVIFTAACKERASDLAGSQDIPPGGSWIEKWTSEGTDLVQTRPIRPSEIYNRVKADEEKRKQLIGLLASRLEGLFGEPGGADELGALKEKILTMMFAGTGVTPQDLTGGNLVTVVDKLVMEGKLDIDRFPTLPLQVVPLIQSYVFSRKATPTPGEFPGEPEPYRFQIKTTGCDEPAEMEPQPIIADLVYRTSFPIDDTRSIHDCFHDNNVAMSKILNILASRKPGGSPGRYDDIELTITLDAEDSVKGKFKDHAGLLKLLTSASLSMEVFSTRVLVDFLGYSFREPQEDGDLMRPIRMPAWFSGSLMDNNNRPIAIAGEHSEIETMLHSGDGRRLLQVRYYMGIPSPSHPNIPSLWRPHTEKASVWHGLHREKGHIMVYTPDKLADAEPWFDSVARTLRSIQRLHNVFSLPLTSYGFLVCSDSVVLADAVYQCRHGKGDAAWLTNVFPIVRATEVKHFGSGMDIFFSKMLAEQAIPEEGYRCKGESGSQGLEFNDFLNTYYPPDYRLSPDAFRKRLSRAFPEQDQWRLQYFPRMQGELEDL